MIIIITIIIIYQKNNILTSEENEVYNIIYSQYYISKVTNTYTNSPTSTNRTFSDDDYQQNI